MLITSQQHKSGITWHIVAVVMGHIHKRNLQKLATWLSQLRLVLQYEDIF